MEKTFTRTDMIRFASWTYQMELEEKRKAELAESDFDKLYWLASSEAQHSKLITLVSFITGLTCNAGDLFADECDNVLEEIKRVYKERNVY